MRFAIDARLDQLRPFGPDDLDTDVKFDPDVRDSCGQPGGILIGAIFRQAAYTFHTGGKELRIAQPIKYVLPCCRDKDFTGKLHCSVVADCPVFCNAGYFAVRARSTRAVAAAKS